MVKVTENGMGITGIFYAATRAIKGGVEAVVELDTALVELNKVTDVSSSQLNSFVSSARDAGDAVARTTSEMVDATAQFAKMGFSLSESLDLASQAAILVNISDGIDDITTASSSLISVLKGFNLEASESSRILDVINEVSNRYAVSSSDITGAMAKVSATLAAQNNTLEESVALVTAGNEILQDFSRTATGIRTISLRLTGVDENGEEIDGLTSSLQQYFDEYETGVQLMNSATGEWNSTYSILSQLSKTWETLTAEEQSHLTYLVSGIRQSDIMNSILTNQETLTNSLTTALGAEGSALKENAIYMDSIQAKVNLFNKETQDMWQNTISSDTIKFFVDLGTSIVKVIDKVGLLNSGIFILASYLTMTGKLSLAIPMLKTLTAGFARLTFGITSSAVATTALTSAMTMGLSALITLMVALTAKVVMNRIEEVKRIEAITDSYEENKAKLNELKNEMAGFGEVINSETEKLKIQIAVLEEQIDLQEKLIKLKNQEKAYDTLDSFDASVLKKYKDTLRNIDIYNKSISETDRENIAVRSIYTSNLIKENANLLSIQEDLSVQYQELRNVIKTLGYDALDADMKQYYHSLINILGIQADMPSHIKEYILQQTNAVDSTDELTTAQEDFNTVLDDTISNLESLESIYSSIQKGEKLSLSTLYDLQQQYPNLTNLIWHANDSKEAGLKLTEAINKAEKQTLLASNALAKGEIENNLKIAKAKLINLNITGAILEANAYANKESIGAFSELQTTIYNLTNDLNNLDVVMANIDNYDYTSLFSGDSPGGGTDSATNALSAYFDQLNKISTLQAKISELEAREGASGLDLTKEKVEIYKQLQNELDLYTNSLENEKDALEKTVLAGDAEVERRERLAEIEASLIDLSTERYEYTQKINEALEDSTELATTSLSAYFDQLNKISILKAELSETEAKEEALGLDLTEDKVETYKQLQNELHSYADSLRDERDMLEKIVLIGDDEIARRERLAEINTSLIDLSAEYYGYTQKINEELDNTEDIIENHLDILKEKIDLQKEQEELLSAQKEAIETLVDLEEDRIKQALEDQIDDLEKQKDLQSDLVDLVNDKLKAEKDTNDFNDSIADKQKEEADILSKINKLRLDPSQKGKITELEEELADIRQEIAEEQSDREYDVRVDTLDKNLDAYDDSKDEEIDILKAQLSKEGELRKQAMKNISSAINTEGSKIYEELISWNSEYGTSIETDITSAWDSAKDALSGYSDVLSGLGGIDSGIANAQAIQSMMENSSSWFDASPEERTRLESANMKIGTDMGWTRDNGVWYDQQGVRAYATGGVNTDDGMAMLHKNEMILNEGQIGNLFKFIKDYSSPMSMGAYSMPEYSKTGGDTNNSPVFSINISGNADKSTVAKIQRAGDNMIQTFWKRGQGRPVQALG